MQLGKKNSYYTKSTHAFSAKSSYVRSPGPAPGLRLRYAMYSGVVCFTLFYLVIFRRYTSSFTVIQDARNGNLTLPRTQNGNMFRFAEKTPGEKGEIKKEDKIPPKNTASKKPTPSKKTELTIPHGIRQQLQQLTVLKSLNQFNITLYNRAIKGLSLSEVLPMTEETKDVYKAVYVKNHSLGITQFKFNPKFTICKPQEKTDIKLTISTSMYHSVLKQFIFNNTLLNYALLRPQVQPILFVCDKEFIELSGYLIWRACHLGWTVVVCPKRTPYGYPILNSMYFYAMHLYNVEWIGYVNGDILFSTRLASAIEYIKQNAALRNVSLLSSRRINAYVTPGQTIHSLEEAENLVKNRDSTLHKTTAIDYFIYRRNASIFNSMPNFCIGRRGYDNWLVYHQIIAKQQSVDISSINPAIHLGIKGISFKANSHVFNTNESDFNMHLSTGHYWLGSGELTCLTHILDVVNISQCVKIGASKYRKLHFRNLKKRNVTVFKILEPLAYRKLNQTERDFLRNFRKNKTFNTSRQKEELQKILNYLLLCKRENLSRYTALKNATVVVNYRDFGDCYVTIKDNTVVLNPEYSTAGATAVSPYTKSHQRTTWYQLLLIGTLFYFNKFRTV